MLSPTLRSVLGLSATASCLLLACAAPGCGAELAQWSAGDGQIADAAAVAGTGIGAGVILRSSPSQPARIELSGDAKGSIELAPGSEISFSEGATESGQAALQLTVNQGSVQVDLADKGHYAAVDVVTGNLQVEVVGTLFLVGTQPHDTGYVALVHGHIRARLAALKKATNEWFAVEAHHGIGSGADGLNPVDALTLRPQLFSPDGRTASLRDQGMQTASASAAAASWHQDAAGAAVLQNAMHATPGLAGRLVARNVQAAAEAEAAMTAAGHADEAKHLVDEVAIHAPGSLASFCAAAVVADSVNATQIVATATSADPAAAASIIKAVLTDLTSGAAGADHASPLDVVVAAVVADPAGAADIEKAALEADPADKNAMLGLLNILAPNAQAGASTTTASSTGPATTGTGSGIGQDSSGTGATASTATGSGSASDFNLPSGSANTSSSSSASDSGSGSTIASSAFLTQTFGGNSTGGTFGSNTSTGTGSSGELGAGTGSASANNPPGASPTTISVSPER